MDAPQLHVIKTDVMLIYRTNEQNLRKYSGILCIIKIHYEQNGNNLNLFGRASQMLKAAFEGLNAIWIELSIMVPTYQCDLLCFEKAWSPCFF